MVFNWKGFLVFLIVLAIAGYFHSQLEIHSIERVMLETFTYSILFIGFLITITKPDIFIKKTMKSGEKWIIRILGATFVIFLIWRVYSIWEAYFRFQQLGN